MAERLIGPAPVWQESSQREQLQYTLSLITPMFGGGAVTKKVADPPIRAASIRGALRFWWRATAGRSFKTPEELFTAESSLWGNTSVPGTVRIRVAITKTPLTGPCGVYSKNHKGKLDFKYSNNRFPPYALFPFQGEVKNDNVVETPAECVTELEFTVAFELDPADRSSIETAVAAWVTFGGVGSRTRRGCGSLRCTQLGPLILNSQSHAELLTGLPATYFTSQTKKDPIEAWETAVETYRDFRQAVPFARNEGNNGPRPGQSLWPEPDSIRRITGQWESNHKPHVLPEYGFPRADFGLPIIFHFQSARDPANGPTLIGETDGNTRFASPVITKALAINGNNNYVPMIAVLSSPHVWKGGDIELKYQGGKRKVAEAEIAVVAGPMKKFQTSDIRTAFIEFIKRKGFSEVQG